MFSKFYQTACSAYDYFKSIVANNRELFILIPLWFELLSPNLKYLENMKPMFNSIYEAFTYYKNNPLQLTDNKFLVKVDENEKPKKKKESIPKAMREAVWVRYHGDKKEGVCYCCGRNIERDCWHCSHVFSENKNGKVTVENLRTCCQKCNLSMGNQNLYAYIRDKNLKGPGYKNITAYFKKNPSQINDKRTNNWGGNNKKKNNTNDAFLY